MKDDLVKTKQELIEEISILKTKIKKLKKIEPTYKQAEKGLQEIERNMNLALEGTDQGLWEWDIHSRKVVYDENWQRIMNLPSEERYVDTEQWLANMDAAGRAEFETKMTNYLAGRERYYEFVHRLQTGNKDWKWIWTRGITLERDPSGIPLRMIGTYRDVTAQKRAETELSQSEERLHTIFKAAAEGILVVDKDARSILYANTAICDFLGYTESEILQLCIDDLHPAESRQEIIRSFDLMKTKSSANSGDLPYLCKNGTIVYGNVNSSEIELDGKITLVGFITDVTARKCLEDSLKLSEVDYKRLFDSLPVAIYQLDYKTGRFSKANDIMCQYLGCSQEELTALNPYDILTDESKQLFSERLTKIGLGEKVAANPEFEIIDKNGKRTVVQLDINNISNAEGLTIGADVVAHNVTERRQAEREKEAAVNALKESEERFRRITENMSDFVTELDAQGIIKYLSPSNKRGLGRNLDDLAGHSVFDYIHPEERDRVFAEFMEAMEMKTDRETEYRIRHEDGHYVWVHSAGHIVLNDAGENVSTVINSYDITERKRIEKELSSAHQNLESIVHERTMALAEANKLLTEEVALQRITEQTLINSEIELHQSQRIAGLGVYVLDISTRIFEFSKVLYELFGIDERHDHSIDGLMALIHPDDRAMMGDYLLNKVIGQKKFDGKEFRIVRFNDKSTRWIHALGKLAFDANGLPIKLNGTAQDITERKKNEQLLTTANEQQQIMLDASPAMIFYKDKENRFIRVNEALAIASGLSKEELEGKTMWDLYPREAAEHYWQYDKKVMAAGKPILNIIEEMKTPQGNIWVQTAKIPYRNSNGEIQGIIGFTLNINERKQIEKKLHEITERLHHATVSAKAGIWDWNLKTNEMIWDDRMLELYGLTRENFTNGVQSWEQGLHPDDYSRAIAECQAALRGERDFDLEFRVLHPDGKLLYLKATGLVLRDGEGKPHNMTGLNIDITELKHSSVVLREALTGTVQAMATLVEARDPYTSGHQQRVAKLAQAIASEMCLSDNEIEGIQMAALVHDLGKIVVPAEILSKPTQLKKAEFELIKDHPQAGHEMLKDIVFPWPIARIILEHHEMMDGTGYPTGLTGENILLESRIIMVADVVDAMASHRPYRPSLGIDAALMELEKNKGTKYDVVAVESCLSLFREKGYQI